MAPSATVTGGADQHALLLDPPAAGVDLRPARLGMDAALAARLELEVLDGVGDVSRLAIDAGVAEGAVEQLAGGTDERAAGKILLIAGLLADEHQRRIERPLAEHGLCRRAVERTARARLGFGEQRLPGRAGVAAGLKAALRLDRRSQALLGREQVRARRRDRRRRRIGA